MWHLHHHQPRSTPTSTLRLPVILRRFSQLLLPPKATLHVRERRTVTTDAFLYAQTLLKHYHDSRAVYLNLHTQNSTRTLRKPPA